MGTTLTGTTPQDTYDSLIKVTDNGPLSATAKYLSDGLGNDSTLALSTAGVGIGNSTPSSFLSNGNQLVVGSGAAAQGITIYSNTAGTGNLFFADGTAGDTAYRGFLRYDHNLDAMQIYTAGANERMTITSAGNVGIGTSAPSAKLNVQGSESGASPSALLRVGNSGAGNTARILLTDDTTADGNIVFKGSASGASSQYIGLGIAAFDTIKITGDSYLRMASGTGGIQFNGDTAAANALDDYEEGTWTMTAGPQASGTITLGTNGGTYTKIGRQVTCTGRAIVSSVSSPVGGYVQFGGLPFTPLNLVAAQSSPSIYFADASAGYASSSIPSYLPNNLTVFYAFKDASTIAASDEFAFTITYFV